MKKSTLKFLVITSIFLLLIFNSFSIFAAGMPNIPETQFITARRSPLVYIIRALGNIILITLLSVPVMKYFISKSELSKAKIDDENERKEKKKINIRFIVQFLVCGGIGVFIKMFSVWLTQMGLKPIIYLYPEKEERVKVKLGKKEKLTCTYPKYEDEWNVIAKPNGDLTDLKTGRNLYALYWEGLNTSDCDFKEGFCVKGEDSISFLEEKLAILGLNEREANEFIVYWLPKLEKNRYNLIRFESMEEINENMPLEIYPNPDTVIRIMMQFKGVKNYMEIKEQELCTPERKGFTVVEWGGTKVK